MSLFRQYDWDAIRAEWESGATMRQISAKHGVAISRLSKVSKRDGWQRKAVNSAPDHEEGGEHLVHPHVHPAVHPPCEALQEPENTEPDGYMNPQRELFVVEYLKDFSPSRAARRAGYHPQHGRRLMGNKAIRRAISAAVREWHHDLVALRRRLVQEDINRAFFDIRELLDFGPGHVVIKSLEDLAPEVTSCISKVREVRQKDGSTTVEVEVYNKDAAAERLYRHLGMFKDKVTHEASDPLSALLKSIADRGRELPQPVQKDGEA